jgi:Domain of unknown function (DUF4158)
LITSGVVRLDAARGARIPVEVSLAARFFSDEELARLRTFPSEISRDEEIRYFTLTDDDHARLLNNTRRAENRLGLAVQLATLPWLGFVPDDLTAAPSAAVARLANQLQVSPDALARYGQREQTRTEHLRQVAAYLGWRACGPGELKALDDFLLLRA